MSGVRICGTTPRANRNYSSHNKLPGALKSDSPLYGLFGEFDSHTRPKYASAGDRTLGETRLARYPAREFYGVIGREDRHQVVALIYANSSFASLPNLTGRRNTRGVHRTCNADNRWVQFPHGPPRFKQWGYSSVGMSAPFASERPPVRPRLAPPKFVAGSSSKSSGDTAVTSISACTSD